MRYRYPFIVAALAAGLAVAAVSARSARQPGPAAPGAPPLLAGVHRVVCMGDSITQGGGGPGGYVWLLQHYLSALYPGQSIEVVNAGISGHKSTDMEARFQRDVVDKQPDLVTINVGINDVWHGFYDNHPLGDGPRGVPLETYRAKVQAMVDMAKGARARVVLVSPTVIQEDLGNRENAKLLTYVKAMREIATRNGCAFVDLNAAFRDVLTAYQRHAGTTTKLLTVDGVHMNGAGNQVMAHSILRGMGIGEKELKAAGSKL